MFNHWTIEHWPGLNQWTLLCIWTSDTFFSVKTTMVKIFLGSILFLACLATGTSRYRYERPSRVVEIKQGRLQGTLVEVPLTSPFSGGDKNQVRPSFNFKSQRSEKCLDTFKSMFPKLNTFIYKCIEKTSICSRFLEQFMDNFSCNLLHSLLK